MSSPQSVPPPSAADLAALGLPIDRAEGLVRALASWSATLPPAARWQRLRNEGWLHPGVPFAVHLRLYDHVFADWDERQGPRPAWVPDPEAAARTNIGKLLAERGFTDYQQAHAWSVRERGAFWQWAIDRLGLRLRSPYSKVLDESRGPEHPRWLVGARLNLVESCLAADPALPAIITGGPDGSSTRSPTVSWRARWPASPPPCAPPASPAGTPWPSTCR